MRRGDIWSTCATWDDPLVRAFVNAPEDDEPQTEEERAAVEEGKEEIRRGQGRPWEEVRKELDADE